MATETRRFTALDAAGNRLVIVASRSAPQGAPAASAGAWVYRTADGRPVRRGAALGAYTVEGTGTRLATDDPNEPKD